MTEPMWYQAFPQMEFAYKDLMYAIREQRPEIEIEAHIAYLVGIAVGYEMTKAWVPDPDRVLPPPPPARTADKGM